MRKVKVITDSCADLSAELLQKYSIAYAHMSTVLDGVVSPARLEWTQEEIHEFYNLIREGKHITTAQVTAEEYEQLFTKYLEQGMDIVYLACALRLSGSLNTARLTAQKLLEKYPEAKIICLDSLNSSYNEGIVVIEAAKLAAEGKAAEEIEATIVPILNTALQYCAVHTLTYMQRAGRVTASKAFLGNLMGVKPILVSAADGGEAAYKKVKGRKNSLNEIVNLLKENIIDPENQTVYIAHADCDPEEVEYLKGLVKEQIPCKEIYVGSIGPIIGATTGPDAISVYALGKEVTFLGEDK